MNNKYANLILIVDDNSDLLTAYSNLLSKSGYKVICSESGKNALEILEKETVSLILLDVMLPDISGLEVLKTIKSDPALENIFVVLISSLATSSANQSEGLETGADGYITTPVQNREFIARIEAFLRHKRTLDKLKASESEYHKLYTLMRLMSDTMPDMLWAKDLNNKFIFANKAICDNLLNAVDTSEPIGKTDIFFAERERDSHPKDHTWHTFGELCLDSDEITLKAMEKMQFDEYGNVKGNFLYLDVHKAPLFDQEGELIGIVGSARDITSGKEAEEALKENERLLRESQAIARLGSFVWDITGGLWNSSLILDQIFDIDENYKRTLDGWLQIVHPDWQEIMNDYVINEVIGKLQKFDKEYQIIRQNDGEVRWVHGIAELEFDDYFQPIKLIGTITDITQRKHAEEALKFKMEELERFNDLTVGRELKMIELKREINLLMKKMGEKEKYKIVV
jgi:DNA-binding response OmpR family regulator